MALTILDFIFPAKLIAQYQALTQEPKMTINVHMRTHIAGQTLNKVSSMLVTAGWVCRVIRSNLKFNIAVVFLSKNSRLILSKNSENQSWTQTYLKNGNLKKGKIDLLLKSKIWNLNTKNCRLRN